MTVTWALFLACGAILAFSPTSHPAQGAAPSAAAR
jgi:hypothetical protein